MSRATKKNKKTHAKSRAARRFWLTPKSWNRPCNYCEATGSLAYRPRDRAYACAACMTERGIVAKESARWRNGGSRTDPSVRIRFADPATLLR